MAHQPVNGLDPDDHFRDDAQRAADQARLQAELSQAFAAESEEVSSPVAAMSWLTRMLNKGLTQVHSINVSPCFARGHHAHLVRRVQERTADPELAQRLSEALRHLAESDPPETSVIACLLRPVIAGELDRVVQQARGLGHREACVHVTAARFEDTVVVLSDNDRHFKWLLPAVRQRLRETLVDLEIELDPERTQSVDLARGEKLLFLGFEVRCALDSNGRRRTQYRSVKKGGRWKHGTSWPALDLRGRTLRLVRGALSSLRQISGHLVSWIVRHRFRPGIGSLAIVVSLLLLVAGLTWYPSATPTTGFVDHEYTDADGETFKYVVYVPPAYDRRASYPLLVFLHGFSDRGRDGRAHLKVGLAPAIRLMEKAPAERPFRFFALFPQSRSGSWLADSLDGRMVMEQIAAVEKRYAIDRKRIYLSGHSSGGVGTWNLATTYPDRWAAIVPVCGAAAFSDPSAIAQIPCWCFHGEADRIFRVQDARLTMKLLKEAGGHPRYTEFPGLEHNIWRKVYVLPELYDWLAQQRLSAPRS